MRTLIFFIIDLLLSIQLVVMLVGIVCVIYLLFKMLKK